MSKPQILQVGPYPAWDQEPLDAKFTVHRYLEADDKDAFLASVAPGSRRSQRGASSESRAR